MKHLGVRSMRYTGVLGGAPVDSTVDCGAEECFLAEEVAQRLGLARVKLEKPLQVEAANGDIMLVTKCTTNLVLKVGKWKEKICLNVVPLIGH